MAPCWRRPRSAYAFGLIHYWARLGARLPGAVNLATQTPGLRDLAKLAAGIAHQRRIPPFAPYTFKEWVAARPTRPPLGGPRVILWPDTFNNHFHPRTAIHAVNVLERAGFEVDVPQTPMCCGRPLYDYGMLDTAKVKPLDVVYDLGCGDGRMVIAAAKKYGARGVGVDLDPARIREAKHNAKVAGVEKLVEFRVEDMFKTDIKEATVVLIYLLPALNRRLKPRFFAELPPGARIVSHDFDMGRDWPPDEYVKLGQDGIYMWVMPPYADRPARVTEGSASPATETDRR